MKNDRLIYKNVAVMPDKCWYCGNALVSKHTVLESPDGHTLRVHRICATPAGQLLKYPLKESTC